MAALPEEQGGGGWAGSAVCPWPEKKSPPVSLPVLPHLCRIPRYGPHWETIGFQARLLYLTTKTPSASLCSSPSQSSRHSALTPPVYPVPVSAVPHRVPTPRRTSAGSGCSASSTCSPSSVGLLGALPSPLPPAALLPVEALASCQTLSPPWQQPTSIAAPHAANASLHIRVHLFPPSADHHEGNALEIFRLSRDLVRG